MSDPVWLYTYENAVERKIYIGIAKDLARVWGQHNEDAEQLRENPQTKIQQTAEPFSTVKDALRAEAIAIHVATLAGMSVINNDDEVNDELGLEVTNRAGTRSTSVLTPAVFRREGHLDYRTLESTAIVVIRAEVLDERVGPYSQIQSTAISERARKWWKVSPAKRGRVTRLIAILADSKGLILGDWDVDPDGSFGDGERVEFPLVDPADDDPRGVKGTQLVGVSGQPGPVYSADLTGK